MAESLVAMHSAALSTRAAISHAARPAASAARPKAVCSVAKKLSSQGKMMSGASLKSFAPAKPICRSRNATQVPTCTLSKADPAQPLSSQMTSGGWEVHKYGGTCVGSAERIKKGAQLIIDSPGDRKLLIVSAMGGVPKVTDLLLGVLAKASRRDETFNIELDALLEKHITTAGGTPRGRAPGEVPQGAP